MAAHRLLVLFGPGEGVTRALGTDPVRIGRETDGPADIELDDSEVSRHHAMIEPCPDGWRIRDLGSRNKTLVNAIPVTEAVLADGDVIRIGAHLLLFQFLTLETASLLESRPVRDSKLVGDGVAMQALRAQIAEMSGVDAPALILGESGVGKELVAAELHRAGPRRDGPFVAVNCAALPESLAESELFGHARGAYTGATGPSVGLFGSAEKGTLFLDEIGETPLPLQAKLLRALATGEVRSVGETKVKQVDVRVVAATNVDLEKAVEEGRFRGDLLARLAGAVVEVAPLRERREDVIPLVRHFLGDGVALTPDAAEALLVQRWPYNVRQLEQTVRVSQRAAQAAGELALEHLPEPIRRQVEARDGALVPDTELPLALRVRRDRAPGAAELREVFTHFEGNVSRVAEFFGKDRKQIYRWAERLGVETGSGGKADSEDEGSEEAG